MWEWIKFRWNCMKFGLCPKHFIEKRVSTCTRYTYSWCQLCAEEKIERFFEQRKAFMEKHRGPVEDGMSAPKKSSLDWIDGEFVVQSVLAVLFLLGVAVFFRQLAS